MTETPYFLIPLFVSVERAQSFNVKHVDVSIHYQNSCLFKEGGLYKAKVMVTGIRGCTVKFACVYDIQINN